MAISQAASRGRPRDPRVDDAVSKAALEVFRERGYADSSLIEIARRAKVGTPTLYRRWRSKSALALDLLARESAITFVDSGDIRRDLAAYLRNRLRIYADPLYAHLVLAVTALGMLNDGVAERVAEVFNSSGLPAAERLQLARARGELPAGTDCELILDLLAGSVAVPLMFTRQSRPDDDAERIVAAILDGLGA